MAEGARPEFLLYQGRLSPIRRIGFLRSRTASFASPRNPSASSAKNRAKGPSIERHPTSHLSVDQQHTQFGVSTEEKCSGLSFRSARIRRRAASFPPCNL